MSTETAVTPNSEPRIHVQHKCPSAAIIFLISLNKKNCLNVSDCEITHVDRSPWSTSSGMLMQYSLRN